MGTQQLLLIALGVFVITVMIIAGFMVYTNYLEDSNRDQLVSLVNDIAVNAQIYYKKPKELGGGGGEFSDWQVPSNLDDTDAGSIRFNIKSNKINLNITGKYEGINEKTPMRITAVINPDGVSIRIKN